jgi:hypothetical protein
MVYLTDAHIAGSTHVFPTKTGDVQIMTDLPCEEEQYESGVSNNLSHNIDSSSFPSERTASHNFAQL